MPTSAKSNSATQRIMPNHHKVHPDVFKEVFGEMLMICPQNYELGRRQEKGALFHFESCLSVLSCISKNPTRPSTEFRTDSELIRLISCFNKRVQRSRKLYCILIFSLPRGSDFGLAIKHRAPQFIPVKQGNQLSLQ